MAGPIQKLALKNSRFLVGSSRKKAAAQVSLGFLCREEDYPTSEDLRRAFAFAYKLQPLPDGRDWRIDLPEATASRARSPIARNVARPSTIQGMPR